MFEFAPYHLLLVALGSAIVLAHWLPRFVSGREPAASALLIGLGWLAAIVSGGAITLDPVANPRPWEILSEMCVIVGLFGVGLRIDRLAKWRLWRPTVRLLVVAMPLCIAGVAWAGWAWAGMTLAGALLLGAVLAPTDPVLAGDVQVGPPLEGGEHPVRFALTTEAGLNDGLAFPFLYLAIAIASAGGVDAGLLGTWAARDLIYRIVIGSVGGLALGWLLGKVSFSWPTRNPLAETDAAITAFASVLIVYGATELAEGYGFIAAFVAGLALRRAESRHDFHAKLHDFTQTIEHVLTAVLLFALGAAIPVLLPHLTWPGMAVGLALLFVIRPVAAWFALAGTIGQRRERAVVAFYGIRGIGSVYYISYGLGKVAMADAAAVWAIVAFTIVVSTAVHGFTAGIALERATGETQDGEGSAAAGT